MVNTLLFVIVVAVDIIVILRFFFFFVRLCVNAVVSMVAALTSPSCCAYAETLSVNERMAYDGGHVLRADVTKV